MGLTLSSLFKRLVGNEEMRILMVGLDAAGKYDSVCSIVAFFLLVLVCLCAATTTNFFVTQNLTRVCRKNYYFV
jgi:hypothetical protein